MFALNILCPILSVIDFHLEDKTAKKKCVMFWKIPSLCLADTNQLSNAHVSKTPRSKQQLPPTNSSAATLASPLHLHLGSLKQRRCQQKDCHLKKPDGTYPDVTKIWHGLMYPLWYIEPLAKIAKRTKLHIRSYSYHHVVHLETKSWIIQDQPQKICSLNAFICFLTVAVVAPKQNVRKKPLKTPRFPDVFGGLLQQVDQLLRSPFGRSGDERRFLHPNGFLLDKFGRFGRNLVSWYFLRFFVKFEITVATCFFSNLSGVNQDPPREPKADLMHKAQGLCNVFLYHFKPVSILCLSLVPSSNA